MAYTHDHRNDVKMIKTLQWNHSIAARGFTTKFEQVDAQFLWSIKVSTMEDCSRLAN